MTTRLSVFDSPLFLGFDQFEKTIDRMRKTASEGYPPYNIEQIGENGLRITLAVAGFTMNDLTITAQGESLSVAGKMEDKAKDEGTTFLHRGIATRSFQRTFRLADHIKVTGASMENGLLHVELAREIPEALKPRKIAIQASEPTAKIEDKAA